MKLFKARGSAELKKVTSGSAMQGLWLGDRKVESQEIGKGRSRLPRRGAVGEVKMKEDEEEEPATEQRSNYTDFGLDLGERKEEVACHASALALAMTTNEAGREAEM